MFGALRIRTSTVGTAGRDGDDGGGGDGSAGLGAAPPSLKHKKTPLLLPKIAHFKTRVFSVHTSRIDYETKVIMLLKLRLVGKLLIGRFR